MKKRLEVRGLKKSYGQHQVLKSIDFALSGTGITALLGINGAGKSTLLNCICVCQPFEAGSVLWNGRDLLHEGLEARKQFLYMPETDALYPDMTVRESLDFAARLYGLRDKQISRAVQRALNQLGLGRDSGRLICNLSKGYRRRVAIARCLLVEADVYVLDEAEVGLDPAQILEFRALLRELGSKSAVLFSSHNLTEVMALADRVILLHGGRIVQDKDIREIQRDALEADRVCLTVDAPSRQASAILRVLTDVRVLSAEPADGERHTSYLLQLSNGRESRKRLFHAFASAGCAILDMQAEAESLESSFLTHTSADVVAVHDEDEQVTERGAGNDN